jgi:hypothetical protein
LENCLAIGASDLSNAVVAINDPNSSPVNRTNENLPSTSRTQAATHPAPTNSNGRKIGGRVNGAQERMLNFVEKEHNLKREALENEIQMGFNKHEQEMEILNLKKQYWMKKCQSVSIVD